jgi:hypothetical protein
MTIYTEAKTNRKLAPNWRLESVSLGVWHCVALHYEDVARRSAKLPGRPILRPVKGHFPICLGLGVYGHGPCLHSLHLGFPKSSWASVSLIVRGTADPGSTPSLRFRNLLHISLDWGCSGILIGQLRVGLAGHQVRIWGLTLKSESASKQALTSVPRVYKHRCCVAF